MAFLRSYVAPFLILLVFLVAMVAVSARIFLPSDMMAPAPIEDMERTLPTDAAADAATQAPGLTERLSMLSDGHIS
ncbi:MAG: hypothetical protein AAF152_03520 [Cyanobacteria bacterium P01_A01_bin.114]